MFDARRIRNRRLRGWLRPLLAGTGVQDAFLLRNDLALALGDGSHEVYAGIDFGQVGGRSAELLVGKRLAGAVLGLRGKWRELTYDVFAGVPLDKPAGFETARVAAGFNLVLAF